MKRFSMSLLCGMAVMLLTVVLYFTILGNILLTAIHFVTLAAILLSEGVVVIYAYFAKGSPRRVAAAIVSGFMFPYSVMLSVVYVVNFPNGYATYIGWYCAGTVIVNALAILLVQLDLRKNDENTQLQAGKRNMLELRKMVMCILADPASKPYTNQLRALEEKLHYSNDSVISNEDGNIRALLQELDGNISNPEFDVEMMIRKIEQSIDARNIMAG